VADSKKIEDEEIKRIQELQYRLANIQAEREIIKARRLEVAKKLYEASKLRDGLVDAVNKLKYDRGKALEKLNSMTLTVTSVRAKQQRYAQMSALNDAFFIWYLGPFATINNFRLGNIRERPVEWTEINAALGQCVLVVSIIASRANIELKKYGLLPMGSFSKAYRMDDKRTLYSLYTDGSFSLFPKRNFNTALIGFMCCIYEIGEYIKIHDPTLCLPYAIDVAENTIQDISFLLGGDDEIWTRALKFMLSDIKWIVAWYTKHYNNYIRGAQ
jgi:beclin